MSRKPLWMIGIEPLCFPERSAAGYTALMAAHKRDLNRVFNVFGKPRAYIYLPDGTTYPQGKTVGIKAFIDD